MRRRFTHLLAPLWIFAAGILFIYFVALFFPTSELVRIVSRLTLRHGATIAVSGIRKSLPLGIRARGVVVSGERGALLAVDRLDLDLRFLPLLSGRLIIGYAGYIGQGRLSGEFELSGPGRLEVEAANIRLEDIPLLYNLSPARITGMMAGNGKIRGWGRDAAGRYQIALSGLQVTGAGIGGTMLPNVASQSVQAVLGVGNGVIKAESVSMQGDGLYARLRGDVRGLYGVAGSAPIDLSLELMPKPDFMDRQKPIFALLARYAVSPGNYLLPIRGTVGKPELQ